jgi:uncharacterized protein (TIGR03435 family)
MMPGRFWVLLLAGTITYMSPVATQTQIQLTGLPQFEVASVKLNPEPGPANTWSVSGHRFNGTKSQVSALIRVAWEDTQLRLEGAPNWINDRYDVVANADIDVVPGSQALAQRLRALLIERFRLAAHYETRQLPMYRLVLARPDRRLGPGLEPPTPDCPVAGGTAAEGVCGPGRQPDALTFGNTGMSNLSWILSLIVGQRVIDQTALTDTYKVDLKFTPPQRLGAQADGLTPLPADAPPLIFDALEEQLGLKLEAFRGPVEVLVIDHIERPSPD